MTTVLAEKAIQEIQKPQIKSYKDYWDSVTPKNEIDYFWRWIFAFLSVHVTWSANINAYSLLHTQWEAWQNSKTRLTELIKTSGVGLHTRRVQGIWGFKTVFMGNPNVWKKDTKETWTECRDRLQKQCFGLGLTKTSFALEMCYPNINESVCLDTHILQLYGHKTPADRNKAIQYKNYIKMEEHWVKTAIEKQIPPYIARCIYWDQRQKQETSRYWSYVLEQ